MEGLLQHEARRSSPPSLLMASSSHHHQRPLCRVLSSSSSSSSFQKTTTSPSLIVKNVTTRSKTFYSLRTSEKSLASSSRSSSSCTEQSFESHHHSSAAQHEEHSNAMPIIIGSSPSEFRLDVLNALHHAGGVNNNAELFTLLRKAIEPHLRQARLARERSRPCGANANIGCSTGFPYPSLRVERRFLFCEHSFPLHDVLADVLGLQDLAHCVEDEADLLLPLLNTEQRVRFQEVYDSFVNAVCLPFLHSMAMSGQVFQDHTHEHARVTYRYQAFPTIQVSRPDHLDRSHQASTIPHQYVPTCDTALGYGPGCLTFHVPLTPCGPSNSMYTETRPGREDWHPLDAKSIGLGYLFDGARCLSFYLPNTSDQCSVALTFRVQIYQHEAPSDAFTNAGPGYYEEAVVNLQPGSDAAIAKKNGGRFLAPDHRNGYPFI